MSIKTPAPLQKEDSAAGPQRAKTDSEVKDV